MTLAAESAPLPERPGLALDDVLRNEADMAFRRRVRTVVELLEPHPGDAVLDAGCGHGFYLRTLAELFDVRSTGLEYSPGWLAQARRELAGTGAALVRGDLAKLPFADGSFDKLIMSEVLEHVVDDAAALAEGHRVLRPGGIAAITVPHANYPVLWDPVNKFLERAFGTHLPREPLWLGGIWADHHRLYTPETLAERVVSAGFRVVELRRLTHYCFPFAHHLFYGLGKALLLSGRLPRSLELAADRFRYRENPARWWNPVTQAVRLLRAIDSWNDRSGKAHATYLNIALKAVRQ